MSQRRHESPELGAAARRFLRALAVRATEGDTEAIEQLRELEGELQHALGSAIAGARAAKGYSWAQIADLIGTTRQNAQQRFRDAQAPDVHPCDYGCGQLFPTEIGQQSHHVKAHGAERCPKATVPAPRRCTMPVGHHDHGWPCVMVRDDGDEAGQMEASA